MYECSTWNEKIEGKKPIKNFFNGMDKILLKPSFNNQIPITLPIFIYLNCCQLIYLHACPCEVKKIISKSFNLIMFSTGSKKEFIAYS